MPRIDKGRLDWLCCELFGASWSMPGSVILGAVGSTGDVGSVEADGPEGLAGSVGLVGVVGAVGSSEMTDI